MSQRNTNKDYNKEMPQVSQKMIVAMNIYDFVQASGLSQAEIAKRTGLSTSTISAYVTGKNYPRPEQMALLARALGVSVAALTGEINDRGIGLGPEGSSGSPDLLGSDEDARELLRIWQIIPTGYRRIILDVARTLQEGYNSQRYGV